MKNHLKVIRLLFRVIVEVEVPSGSSRSLHTVHTWTIQLCSLIYLVIFCGKDETSDQKLLVLILRSEFWVHEDLILDVIELLEGVIVCMFVLLQECRPPLRKELVASVVLVHKIIVSMHKVFKKWKTSHEVGSQGFCIKCLEMTAIRRHICIGVETNLDLL